MMSLLRIVPSLYSVPTKRLTKAAVRKPMTMAYIESMECSAGDLEKYCCVEIYSMIFI